MGIVRCRHNDSMPYKWVRILHWRVGDIDHYHTNANDCQCFWRDELHDISILRKWPYHSQFELLGKLYNCKLLLISSDCCTQLLVYCNHCHRIKLNVDLQSFTYARIRTYIYAQIRTHIHININILISWNVISPTIRILWVKHQLNTGPRNHMCDGFDASLEYLQQTIPISLFKPFLFVRALLFLSWFVFVDWYVIFVC